MFCKEKYDIIVQHSGDSYYVYFNYDFVDAVSEEYNSEGNLEQVTGYECTNYGYKYTHYPSEKELIDLYFDIARDYNHSVVEEPVIFGYC